MKRPPIIVVVGHVDHGKTTLLDTIRKSNLAAKEAGGITQSIGAYEIVHSGERMTFIDTPGHEAFGNMRARGAKAADIAILVVGVDDGVQQQTKEAIKILQESETPFVVAITKIDKTHGEVDRVKNELLQAGVLLEGYGGSISWHGVSAKTGEGINELLDLLALAAEVEGLTYDEQKYGSGFILEAKRDSRKGIMAMAVVTDGILHSGTYVKAHGAIGKIRGLENQFGKREDIFTPSSPVVIIGLEQLPKIGEQFETSDKEFEVANEEVAVRARAKTAADKKIKIINIILKADVSGSLEALGAIVRSIPCPADVKTEIIDQSVGEITDGDAHEAISHNAIIVGFKTEPTKAAETLARGQKVMLVISGVVYDLVKTIEELIKAGGELKPLGELEVLAIFGKKDGRKRVIGGKVIAGELQMGMVEVGRAGAVVGHGRIINLQSQKKDITKVAAGNECGMLFDADIEIAVGDHLILRP